MSLSSESARGFAIETHGLSKCFGSQTAVEGLTMRVPAGAIAGFIGPNGAGKTTTIRLLLGLVRRCLPALEAIPDPAWPNCWRWWDSPIGRETVSGRIRWA